MGLPHQGRSNPGRGHSKGHIAVDYSVARNYYGVTHPSLPNYMAPTGGDTFFTSNCLISAGGCTTAAPSIVDRIEGSARTWKAYMEDLPSPCFAGNNYPVYASFAWTPPTRQIVVAGLRY